LFTLVCLDVIGAPITIGAFPTNDPWWGNGEQWALNDISAPLAWSTYGDIMLDGQDLTPL